MPYPSAVRSTAFRTAVRRKESPMLTILAIAAAWGAWRAVQAARRSLGTLPRSNEDMVFY